MNWIQKTDKFWIGLLTGIFFPAFIFTCYWLFAYHQISFPQRFIKYLMNGYLLSNVIKLCGLANLLIFYLGLTYKIDKFNKGVVISVLLYVALVAYICYYHEPEYL